MAWGFLTNSDGILIAGLLDALPDAVVVVDPCTGTIVGANTEAADLTGLPPGNLLGLHFLKLHPACEERRAGGTLLDRLKDRADVKKSESVGILVRRADGSEVPVELTIRLMELNGRKLAVEVLRDVSALKSEIAAVRSSEEKYRLLAEKASDNIWIMDLETMKLTYTSPSVVKLQGFSVEEMLELPLERMLTPASLEKAAALLEYELGRDGEPGVDPGRESLVELEEYGKDGSIINTELRLTFLRDADGRPTSLLGITRDVTERKVAEAALQESEKRFRTIFDSVEETIFLHDMETGAVLDVNRRMYEMFGYTREEALGLGVGAISSNVPPYTQDEALRRIRKAAAGEHQVFEWHIKHKDGRLFWAEITLKRIGLGGTDYVLATARDISERKKAEEDRRILEMQFQQAQKLESVGRLAGGVAHDFNNLLTCITGNVSLSLLQLNTADPIYELLKDVDKAAENAAMLTKQLLAFSRKQVIEPREIDLNDYIGQMQKMLMRMIGEDVVLSLIPGKTLGRIVMDQGQLAQIIINLAVNARDAMPTGGVLSIKTGNVGPGDERFPAESGSAGGGYVMLEIADTGSGMTDEVKNHLFEPFFTTKGIGKGTGLGLATVYGAVKQNNGLIRIDSRSGLGTSVKMFFPEAATSAARTDESGTDEAMKGGKETIFLVEDAPLVRDLAYRILTRLGYNVRAFPGGTEAVAAAGAYGGPIDLLLTDVIMPGMSGPDLAAELLKYRPELKVLFTSGYAENEMVGHGITGERALFLGKPYTPEMLAGKVREVLEGRKAADPSPAKGSGGADGDG